MNEAISRTPKSRSQLLVRIAPPHLSLDENAPGIRAQILRSLARALYFAAQGTKLETALSDRIGAIYNKDTIDGT